MPKIITTLNSYMSNYNPFCIQLFRRTQDEVPTTFSNPIANSSGGFISEIDVRALELDPIVFEPLPTLNDLTPRHGDYAPSNSSMGRAGAIVPFTSDESSLFAHDWFGKFKNIIGNCNGILKF